MKLLQEGTHSRARTVANKVYFKMPGWIKVCYTDVAVHSVHCHTTAGTHILDHIVLRPPIDMPAFTQVIASTEVASQEECQAELT